MNAFPFGVDFLEEGMAQNNILYWNLNAVNTHWNENGGKREREGGGGAPHLS